MFDIHTHHTPSSDQVTAIVNRSFGQPYPDAEPFSAGLHPWFLSVETMGEAQIWLTEQVKNPACRAIGETGLDKSCKIDWELQEEAFHFCIDMAIRNRKPLIIHCVRAYNEVIAIKKQYKREADTIPWIFHGFNKGPQVAEMLLQAGAYLSFGAAILNDKSGAAQSLRICPDDRYYLETDDRDDIEALAIYEAASAIRGKGFIPPSPF